MPEAEFNNPGMILQPFSERTNVGTKFDQEGERVVVGKDGTGEHSVVVEAESSREIGQTSVGADDGVAVKRIGVVEMVEKGSGAWESVGMGTQFLDG